MFLADVARTSYQVSGISSRLSKVSLIADLLRQCAQEAATGAAPADERHRPDKTASDTDTIDLVEALRQS